MREITAECGSVPQIGIRHENGRTVARISLKSIMDMVESHPGGSYTLAYRRRLDDQFYVSDDFTVADGYLEWTVGSHALAVAGDVTVQVNYATGSITAETPQMRFTVGKSIFNGENGQGENLSDLVEAAITAAGGISEALNEAREELDAKVTAAQTARGAAEAAQTAAERAQHTAENAKTSAAQSANAAYNFAADANTAKRDSVNAKDDAVQAKEDAVVAQRAAEDAEDSANTSALKSEGYAVGTQNGTPAGSGEPYYQDNAKYYKEQAEAAKTAAEAARDTAQQTVAGIETAGTAQVQRVTAEGATQVGNVQTKGQQVLDSIPDDYSELSGEVTELKRILDASLASVYSKWEKGTFDSTNGTYYASDARIRSDLFAGISTGVEKINSTNGLSMLLFAWDKNGNFIGSYKSSDTFTKTTSDFKYVTEFDCNKFPNYVIKVSAKNADGSTSISASDGSYIHYQFCDDTLTKKYKAADAEETGKQVRIRVTNQAFNNIVGVEPIEIVHGYYYALNGSSVDGMHLGAEYNACAMCECEPGDEFVLYSGGGDATRIWAFANSNNQIIQVADANIIEEGVVLTAPSNAKYLYSNCNNNNYPIAKYVVAKGNTVIKNDVADNRGEIDAIKYELHMVASGKDLTNHAYIKASDGSAINSSTWLSTDFIDISAFKYLSVKMSNAYTAVDAGFAFYDQAQAYISGIQVNVDSTWTQENQSMSVFKVDVPSGAKYIRASSRITNKDDFSIKSRSGEAEIDTNLPTPIIFFEKDPVTPSAGYENRVLIDKFVDVENIAICARIDVTATTVVFMGTEDFRGQQHASHVQYDFSEKVIRVYAKGTGQAIPSTVLQTIDFSALGDITLAQIYIGRKNRQLWVAVENYGNGIKTEYLVSDGDSYDYPAGWLADRLVYGVISGTATYKRITATTKVSPFIAFIGDSITEGYGIPYDKSWSYQVGSEIGDFLCMGRSGGTVVTAQRQVNDIISKIKPKYVVVCIGTNGGNTVDNIRALCESIRYYGSFPILCRIPTMEYYSTSANVNNNTISPQNENTVGMDYATSILSSGGQDTSKFLSDRLHPNVAGATAMAERFMVDAGWIVIQ